MLVPVQSMTCRVSSGTYVNLYSLNDWLCAFVSTGFSVRETNIWNKQSHAAQFAGRAHLTDDRSGQVQQQTRRTICRIALECDVAVNERIQVNMVAATAGRRHDNIELYSPSTLPLRLGRHSASSPLLHLNSRINANALYYATGFKQWTTSRVL